MQDLEGGHGLRPLGPLADAGVDLLPALQGGDADGAAEDDAPCDG